jgi:putative ABC transport system ATP-binding protein
MGPSGSGKSTLMHCMAGLDTPTSGRTFVGDREIGLLDDAGLTQMRRDQHRVRLPVLQPRAHPDGGRTSRSRATWPRRRSIRPGSTTWSPARDRRPAFASPQRDVRRSAAAGRLRPGPDRRPDLIFADEPTGNLDSNSSGGDAGLPPALGHGIQPVDRHGHPRRPGCRLRRSGRVPGRRNVVDELLSPTADSVLERMKQLGG